MLCALRERRCAAAVINVISAACVSVAAMHILNKVLIFDSKVALKASFVTAVNK